MPVGYAGVQGAFIKKERFGMTVHFAGIVQDRDGTGTDLIQYSQFELRQDILDWLHTNVFQIFLFLSTLFLPILHYHFSWGNGEEIINCVHTCIFTCFILHL